MQPGADAVVKPSVPARQTPSGDKHVQLPTELVEKASASTQQPSTIAAVDAQTFRANLTDKDTISEIMLDFLASTASPPAGTSNEGHQKEELAA